ncbi:MAG: methylmalonyl Co-A mutase-associated GTPase MeaB [Alphaproteobacteria bacterium]|nr:methylmalonyl Co-A mutase-associated GTPase MeaB [Alphaproteobacteria bacterium]
MRSPQASQRLVLSVTERVTAASSLAEALRRGDRRALARAITFVESSRPDHFAEAEQLMAAALPYTGDGVRIGVSGPPGAGKSTFIERFGLAGIARGRRIAVLAVDPGSKRGGGAILADKTRMVELSRSPAAFIRPSSAGRNRGGAARRTREAILLCEAAGFDAVIVESVGVGQSETAVSELTDMFVLILPPAAGDELQGIKRGIVELADIVLVNKADGELAEAAARTAADYASAMRLIRPPNPEWAVPVRVISALEDRGVAEVWDDVARFRDALVASGAWVERRREQVRAALWSEIEQGLLDHLRTAPGIAGRLAALETEVVMGTRTPAAAARKLVTAFLAKP